MSALKLLTPLAITDAMLTSTNVPETDYTAWNAATAYNVGDRAVRTTGIHKIYERLVAGTTATAPESDTSNWLEVSPTNRWKCFDQSNTTATSQATSITYRLTPGQVVNAVALLGLVATSVRIKMTDPTDGVVYDQTTTLQAPPATADCYAYFFGPIRSKSMVMALALPSYRTAYFDITITSDVTAACGVILLGTTTDIGLGVQAGARVGITDYSRKEQNTFGDYTIVRRAWSKRASFDMVVQNSEIDYLQELFAGVRSSACLWIGSNTYESTVIYGFYKDFGITIAYSAYSQCSLELEGLT